MSLCILVTTTFWDPVLQKELELCDNTLATILTMLVVSEQLM